MLKPLIISISLFLLSFATTIGAQVQLSDNAKISLMTTSPWSGASYALFGHTAIFVEDDSTGVEGVFNYGFFDQSKPHFMYNFIRGKTDYVLGVQSLEQFIEDYKVKGVEVVEQELNMTRDEKQKMWEALYINQLPENRKYRYNYFYDNCVTRPRDLIETFVEGKLSYPEDNNVQTYRDLIHECVKFYPWIQFGIDLIIGSDADKPITLRQKMFLPVYLMNALEYTTVAKNDSVVQPVVKIEQVIVEKSSEDKYISEWHIASPIPIAFALIFITLLILVFQTKNLSYTLALKIYDSILFGVIGVGGAIIFFLTFFSEHPATDSNWNFVWMNIFALIVPLFVWLNPMKNVVYIYHFINFVALTLFLLLWWMLPQSLPFATIPFSISLLLRSGTHILMQRRKNMNKNQYTSSKYVKAGWGANV